MVVVGTGTLAAHWRRLIHKVASGIIQVQRSERLKIVNRLLETRPYPRLSRRGLGSACGANKR